MPAAGPVPELAHHRLEGVSLGGELVAHPHPIARLDLTLDETRILELLEPAGEQAVGHPRHSRLELGEVKGPVGERVEDRPRPATPDQLDGTVVVPTHLFWLGRPPGWADAGLRSHLVSSLPIVRAGQT